MTAVGLILLTGNMSDAGKISWALIDAYLDPPCLIAFLRSLRSWKTWASINCHVYMISHACMTIREKKGDPEVFVTRNHGAYYQDSANLWLQRHSKNAFFRSSRLEVFLTLIWVSFLGVRFEVRGAGAKIIPCLKLVTIMLETWSLLRMYTHMICSFGKYTF